MLLLFACNEECFKFGREGDALPNISCETRRAWATYAGLCYFFRLSMFSGHAHTLSHCSGCTVGRSCQCSPSPLFPIISLLLGKKNVLEAFVHFRGILSSSCTPWEGPMTEVSARAPWVACLPGSVPLSRSELHKPACIQMSEKSESTRLCLQGLGAAGIPSLLISQPVVYSSLPYRGLCLGGTFQVDVSCVCSLTKLTCSTQIRTMAFPLQLKSWVLVIMEMFGSSLGLFVSPQYFVLVTLLNMGHDQRPPCWPSLCPPDQLPFSPMERQRSAARALSWSTVPVSTVTWTWKDIFRYLALDSLCSYCTRLCIQGQVFSLSTFLTSVCSSLLVTSASIQRDHSGFHELQVHVVSS